MIPNLIQNFIHTQNTPPSKKEAPHFDIHHELKNKNFIRPLKGEGRLVKDNILYTPINMAKGVVYDIKALRNAQKGDANDHQLGKLNDLGMKLGGLAIAGYLYSKKQTPLTKTMEFVGLGSFFASMALWPKLAIQLPARIMYGFNVQQQYEDSMGRKKPFFQDPQFLPWDLYSNDEINKIGDYMGVPRNIPNRRDFIQEKMKKIAIQSNTLWMLTAGFATPVMSALMCNMLEKPLTKILYKQRANSNHNLLNNFNSRVSSSKNVIKEVDKILSINSNQPISDKLLKELSSAMTENFVSRYATNALIQDMEKLFDTQNYVINDKSINTMIKESKKALNGRISPEIIEKIIPTQEQLTNYFDYEKGYFQAEQTPDQISRIFREYAGQFRKNIAEYNSKAGEKALSKRDTDFVIKTLITAPRKDNPIWKGLTQERYSVLNANNQQTVKLLSQAFNNLNNRLNKIDAYVFTQMGTAPETTVANYWHEAMNAFIKNLKISPAQIDKIKQDKLPVAEVIRNAYDNIASDKQLYAKTVNDFVSKIAEIDKTINQLDLSDNLLNNPAKQTKFDKLINDTFGDFVKELSKNFNIKDGELQNIVDELTNINSNYNFPRQSNGSYADLYKSMVKHRLLGVKSSMYRILNSLDLYRRIALADPEYLQGLKGLPREVKEDIVELCKNLGIKAHSADFYTKFFQHRNPFPDHDDTSNIQVKNGKVVYKYYREHPLIDKVNIPQEKRLFTGAMRLQYEDNLSPETENLLKPYKNVLAELKEYKKALLEKVGSAYCIEKEFHHTGFGADLDSKTIFELIGASTDDIVHNYCKQSYNTRKWLTTFGKTGGILLGLTVLSQFFFGKMKNPKPIAQTTETQKG